MTAMSAQSFDAIDQVREFRAVGFPDEQAEAIAQGLRKIASLPDTANNVTKTDLTSALAETKWEIAKWVIGAGFFQTVAIIATIVSIVHKP